MTAAIAAHFPLWDFAMNPFGAILCDDARLNLAGFGNRTPRATKAPTEDDYIPDPGGYKEFDFFLDARDQPRQQNATNVWGPGFPQERRWFDQHAMSANSGPFGLSVA